MVKREKVVKFTSGSVVYAIRYYPVRGGTDGAGRCVGLSIRDVTGETIAMHQCERTLEGSRNTDAAIEGIGDLCGALKEAVYAMSWAYEKGPAFRDAAKEQNNEVNRILGDIDLRLVEIEKNRQM